MATTTGRLVTVLALLALLLPLVIVAVAVTVVGYLRSDSTAGDASSSSREHRDGIHRIGRGLS
jgi:hypothetical protein